MIRIISNKSIQFNQEELFQKLQSEPDGRQYSTTESRLLDSVSVTANVLIDVPDWVATNEHFLTEQASGNAKIISPDAAKVTPLPKKTARG